MLSFRHISVDAIITNKLLILDFLSLLPSYYCGRSTISRPWPPLSPPLQSFLRLTVAQVFRIEERGGIFPHFVFPSILRFSHGPSSSETSFQNSFCYFVVEHPWNMPSPLYNVNVHIRYQVSVYTQSVQCFIVPCFPDAIFLYWVRYSKKHFFSKEPIICETL